VFGIPFGLSRSQKAWLLLMFSLLYRHLLKNLPLPLFSTCLRLPVPQARQTGAGTHRQKEGDYSSLCHAKAWEDRRDLYFV